MRLEYSKKLPDPKYHSFVITEENGIKSFGIVATVYEQLVPDYTEEFELLVERWNKVTAIDGDLEYVLHVKSQYDDALIQLEELNVQIERNKVMPIELSGLNSLFKKSMELLTRTTPIDAKRRSSELSARLSNEILSRKQTKDIKKSSKDVLTEKSVDSISPKGESIPKLSDESQRKEIERELVEKKESLEEKILIYQGILFPFRRTLLVTSDKLFVPISYCILSHYPFYDFFRDWLSVFLSCIKNEMSSVPTNVLLESYIINLCNELPVPPLGRLECAVIIGQSVLHLHRPPVNKIANVKNVCIDSL